MTRIKMHISNVKLPFYPPSEVKYGLQNKVSTRSEKEGCRDRPHTQMQFFRDVLDECGFMDLGFVGFLSLGTSTIQDTQCGRGWIGPWRPMNGFLCSLALKFTIWMSQILITKHSGLHLKVGVSTGRAGSSLCPTRTPPETFGWVKKEPETDSEC